MRSGIRSKAPNQSPSIRKFSTNQVNQSKIFELRTYTVKPDCFLPFLELTNKYIHFRTAHSKLNGYFVSEIGGVNEVFHIWEYDSLEQRQRVRVALIGDKPWQHEYMVPMRAMLEKQENSLLMPLTEVKENENKNSVFELLTYTYENQAAVDTLYSEVNKIGSWVTSVGPHVNTRVSLYQHDGLRSVDHIIQKNPFPKPVLSSKIGFPTPFSPLK